MTNSTLANDIAQTVKAPAQSKVQAPVKPKPAQKVWRLDITPRGTQLFTYMLAVLKVAGGFTAGRKVMDKKAVSARFDTDTCVTYHTSQGRLEKTKTGIRLTVQGWNYFQGRLNGKNPAQAVLKEEMQVLAQALKNGKVGEKTAHFATDTKFRQVTVK